MKFDYKYLCQGLGHLTGLETRIYRAGELFDHYTPFDFEPDIVGLAFHEIRERDENAFYVETEELLIFGVVRSKKDNVLLVIGPTAQITPGKTECSTALYMLGEDHSRLQELEEYFANMIPYPLENFLGILCFVNYAFNDEKLSISDLIRKRGSSLTAPVEYEPADPDTSTGAALHNTFEFEKTMLSYVTTGNMVALKDFVSQPPTGRAGLMAQNELRQRKNTFICSATLISRAAIEGGLPQETAFALSDLYIQKVELLRSGTDISNLNVEMLLDYTARVEALKCGSESSQFAKKVIRHVMKNISAKLTTADIADALNVNRTYLCERFRLETGKTVGELISGLKIDEAKRLIQTTELSFAQISDYLAFSSQSHFQTVFKKHTDLTPKQYRNKRRPRGGL